MDAKYARLAERVLGRKLEDLSDSDRKVLASIAKHVAISRDLSQPGETLGARVADRVATFGGSWSFIFLFFAMLIVWVGINAFLLTSPPDPYPFVFLNLILSMLAAFQAPVIMMSQNRQSEKDRAAAEHDYEINLKSELEIMRLHEKLDDMRMVVIEGHFTQMQASIDALCAEVQALRAPPKA